MIKQHNKVIVIAEVGVNHNGKIKIAKKMIKIAKNCGADYVKFQNWKANNLVTENAKMAPYQIKNTKKKQRQIDLLKPLELKKNDYFILKTFANKNKINFLSSPFDEENYLFLTKNLKCKEIKIPSGEINNFLMLSNINLKKEYIFISTGMSNLEEIAHTLNFIAKKKVFKVKKSRIIINDKKKLLFLKKRLCLLHCVTDYPVDDKFANLNAIKTLEKEFQLNVGYSDHTAGILAPIIAASLGAKVIEKHITLNKKLKGPDHKASLNPIEFKKMVKQIRKLETMMGNGKKVLQKCEIKNILIARKSIVAKKNIKQGQLFSNLNLGIKRPAGGINPSKYFNLIGKKSKKNYKIDQKI